ncbi:MAG: hypothetical protein HOF44_01580 [Pelagibacterales bacterium]|nr:hypothetical protein [Pelagibacterales bacterium]
MSKNTDVKLCSIKVDEERKSAELYEIDFKKELESILCTKIINGPNYSLKWDIKKTYRELIKSASNTTKRYEETLIINFSIYHIKNESLIYSDKVSVKGAYNILEEEIISTLASKKSVVLQIAIIGARLTLDKIHLFMLKDENSKL